VIYRWSSAATTPPGCCWSKKFLLVAPGLGEGGVSMEGKGSAVQAVDLLETLNHRRSAAAKEQRSCSISVTQDREQPPSLVKPVPSSVLADQEEEEEEEAEEEVGGSVVVMGVAAMATTTVKRPASTEISRDKKLAAAEEREKNIARLRRSSCGGYESMQQLQESKGTQHPWIPLMCQSSYC